MKKIISIITSVISIAGVIAFIAFVLNKLKAKASPETESDSDKIILHQDITLPQPYRERLHDLKRTDFGDLYDYPALFYKEGFNDGCESCNGTGKDDTFFNAVKHFFSH